MKLPCPYCTQLLPYDHRQAGKSVVCSYCKRPVLLPQFERLAPAYQEEYRLEVEAARKKKEAELRKQQEAERHNKEAELRKEREAERRKQQETERNKRQAERQAEEARKRELSGRPNDRVPLPVKTPNLGLLMLYIAAGCILLVVFTVGATIWATRTWSTRQASTPAPVQPQTVTSALEPPQASAPAPVPPQVTTLFPVPLQITTPAKLGKVRVTVTWEYNKFVGNKPDTNATVTLIPKSFNGRVPSAGLDPMFAHIAFDHTKKELQQQGVYIGLVSGNGAAAITGVPPGDYKMIIMSNHTNESPDISKLTEEELTRYLDKGNSATLHKIHVTDITVVSGDEVEYSHDFGNTYM